MPRLHPTVGLAALCLSLSSFVAGDAHAQTLEQRLQDAADARGALGATVYANLRVRQPGQVDVRCRVEATAAALDFACTGGESAVNTASRPFALVSALLATGSVEDAVATLGLTVPEAATGYDTLTTPDGVWIVHRAGTPAAGFAFLHPTSQWVQLRLQDGDDAWQATVLGFHPVGNGWWPATLVVSQNGVTVASFSVEDLARTADTLSAIDAPAAIPATTGALRLPRLPL